MKTENKKSNQTCFQNWKWKLEMKTENENANQTHPKNLIRTRWFTELSNHKLSYIIEHFVDCFNNYLKSQFLISW